MNFKSSQTGKFADANQKFSEIKKTNGERGYFRNSEADIKTDYGYNIQKDRLSDNITKVPFKENEKNIDALQQMAHNANKKSDVRENIPSKFIERSELIYEDVHAFDSGDNIISKADGEAAVLLQHSAHKDRKVAREFQQVEKSARKEIDEIRKGENPNGNFRESSIEFSNPVDKFDGKSAEDGMVTQFKGPVNHFDVSDNRKGNEKTSGKRELASQSISKDEKITVGLHEREEKNEPAENNINIEKNKKSKICFNESQVEFTDANNKFTNVMEKMFRKEMTDYNGNSIFENGAIKPAIGNLAGISSGVVIIQSKQQGSLDQNNFMTEKREPSRENTESTFMKDVPETNKSIASYFSEPKTDEPVNNISSSENQNSKTLNTSKDMTGNDEKFMSKEERIDRAESKRKEAKSEKNKSRRKAASKAAFANVLMTKRNMQNNMENVTGEVSGDLIADGSGGILQTIQGNAQSAITRAGAALGDKMLDALEVMAAGIAKAMKALVAAMAPMFGVLMIPLIIIVVLFMLMASGDLGEEYDLESNGDGYVYSSLTQEEIDNIIDSLYNTYNNPDLGIYNMGTTQEIVLRYALSKVGCPYDQNYHGNVTADIFDCSSLAFRSYKEVKINIAYESAYSAAEECHKMVYKKKVVPPGNELLPGDLIFYGGSSNGRYMGVYHVGIYVGNGKMVEAKGKKSGVIYGDVRTNNVVCIGRPWQ